MNTRDVQSDIYMIKSNSNDVIESSEFFSRELYDFRFKTIDKELSELKCNVNKSNDGLNKEIRRLEDKFDKESSDIKAMVDVKYNKIETRLYQIILGGAGFIIGEFIIKKYFL